VAIELTSVSQKEHYLYCHLQGTFEHFAHMEENTRRIVAECERTGCERVLLDFTETSGEISIFDQHTLGNQIVAVAPAKARIAVVPPPHLRKRATAHLENVVMNRFVRLKVFWEMDAAGEWLAI